MAGYRLFHQMNQQTMNSYKAPWGKTLGFFRAYATDLNRTALLRFAKGAVVVSPDDPEAFVSELKR